MKKILITGANSYIGTSFEKWLSKYPDIYSIDTMDMIDGSWKEKNFAAYDVVFHVAGIAHSSIDPKLEPMYRKVNTELAVDTAKKAKEDGAKLFIFMSSMMIYGEDKKMCKPFIITSDTKPNPADFYADSKLKADIAIQEMDNGTFKTAILRPPMVYGPKSKGNFPRLIKLAKKAPIFPNIKNERSMIYIDNLCEFIRILIDREEHGVFFPQNADYICTTDIIRYAAKALHKKIWITKLGNPFIKLLSLKAGAVNKVFGTRVYDKNMSLMDLNYQVEGNESSIYKCIEG
ncbi:MAG: NAD-dependent epimerase/dehydratase family protein [Eubacteriales bacterium]